MKFLNIKDKQRFRLKRDSGFGLIDLMIASSIIFFLLLGIGQLICNSMLFKARADDGVFAAELASSKLEELRGLFYSEGGLENGEFNETIKLNGSAKNFLSTWTIMEIDPGIQTVTVECAPAGLPQKKTRLLLYMNRRLRF